MSGPWEQFQSGRVISSDGPWSQFQAAKQAVNPNVFEGIDLSGDIPAVREAIGKLPEAKRQAALDQWAKVTVARDNAKTGGQGILRDVNNVGEAIARGTWVGSWGDEFDAGLKSAAYALSKGAFGAPYDETVAYNRARQKDFDERNPWGSMGLKVGGAVAALPLTPMRAAAPGASMLSRMGNAGWQGATYGAIYGAGEGEGTSRLVELAKGASLGGALGAGVVPIATGTGNLAKYVADKYRGLPTELAGMNPQAVQKVTRAATDDGLFPGAAGAPPTNAYAQQVAQLGPEGMLADMGPNLLSQTQALTRQPGPGQRILQGALDQRSKGAAQRISQAQDDALGPARDVIQLADDAVTRGSREAKPFYDAFYATPVKPSEALYGLLDRAKAAGAYDAALANMQKRGMDPVDTFYKGYPNSGVNNSALNPRFLDEIKKALDGKIGATNDRTEKAILSDIAKGIRNEVDTILGNGDPSKSSWAIARQKSGEGLRYEDALETGRGMFNRDPDEIRHAVARATDLERDAYREATRQDLRRVSGRATMASASPEDGFAAAAAARKALGSKDARTNIETILDGQYVPAGVARPNPQELFRVLDAETRFADTRNRGWMGSQTSNAMLAAKEFPNAASRREAASEAGKKGFGGLVTESAWRLGNAVIGGHIDARNAAQVRDAARMLAAQGVDRDAIVRGLRKYAQSRAITVQQREEIMRLSSQLYQTPRSYWISENAAEPNAAAAAR